MKFTPIASVRTSTWPGPGSGAGRSRYCRTSGPPAWAASITCIAPTYAAAPPACRPTGPVPLSGRVDPVAREPGQPGCRPGRDWLGLAGGQTETVPAGRVDVQLHLR